MKQYVIIKKADFSQDSLLFLLEWLLLSRERTVVVTTMCHLNL